MKEKIEMALTGLVIVFVTALLFSAVMLNFVNEKEQIHTIRSVDKVEATEGDADGFTTRVYYFVYTDKGAYHIRTAGINAAPQCAGIKADSTYTLVTRGINYPFLGVYPCIIEVKK